MTPRTKTDTIVIHCSATPADMDIDAAKINKRKVAFIGRSMKKNIQAEILKSLNNTNIFLENIFKSNSFSKKKLKDGLFEWSNEDEQFFRINPEKKIYFKNLLFLDNHYDILIKNTKQFLNGNSANSVLLWGSRGTGKSSLVMSLYYSLKEKFSFSMIEIKFFQIIN